MDWYVTIADEEGHVTCRCRKCGWETIVMDTSDTTEDDLNRMHTQADCDDRRHEAAYERHIDDRINERRGK